jgi:hypothetical protein
MSGVRRVVETTITCYSKVILNDKMPADESLSGREIQVIVRVVLVLPQAPLRRMLCATANVSMKTWTLWD